MLRWDCVFCIGHSVHVLREPTATGMEFYHEIDTASLCVYGDVSLQSVCKFILSMR